MTGIETLLTMAVADGRFAAALLEDRTSALAASGVTLTAAERSMLASTDEPALRQLILSMAGTGADAQRRAFLGRAAAALAALAGGVVLAPGCHSSGSGARPAAPPKPATPAAPPPAPASSKPQGTPAPRPPAAPRSAAVGKPADRPGHEIALGSGGYTGIRPGGHGPGLGSRRRSNVRIKFSPPRVQGKLSTELVRRIMRRHTNEVRYCYEKELQRKPGLQGELELSFVIAGKGMVSSTALLRSTLGSKTVERCVLDALGRWLFPGTADGKPATVAVSMNFWKAKKNK